jgi:3-keto-5-aminohexanoate cleavage enzyme
MDAVILEVALNGITTPERNAAAPRLPAELARDALACMEAGAAIVHTHTHEPARPPREGADLYRAAYEPILADRADAILYPTIGLGATFEDRYGHHVHLAKAGAIRQGLVDPGSVNFGESGPDGRPLDVDFVYRNGPRDVASMVDHCSRLGLGPSVACFEPGFLRAIVAYHRAGLLPPGSLIKLYFLERGYLAGGEPHFGVPPIREALDLYLAMLGDCGLPWAVAVLGGSLLDSPIAGWALERGGHLRVGLEDFPDAKSNRDEVERARVLCEKYGRPLAMPAEAAVMLGLPTQPRA